MKEYIKLSKYAKAMGIHYKTGLRHFHLGKIKGYQDKETKTIYIEKEKNNKEEKENRAILYARVSSRTNKASLDGQIDRMRQYAIAKGYTIIDSKKEIASGLNENRKKLENILKRKDYEVLVVEHKDRLSRFGVEYIKQALENNNIKLDIINNDKNKDNEIIEDFVSIITSFCGRIYGRKRKEKTKEIIEKIKQK